MKSFEYKFFTTNEIKPQGWLKKQLEIQAEGLCGNLDKVWPDVRDSAWIGGRCEGWERVPYWLDGFIPLAYLLENEDMIARAKRYIDAIVAAQNEDGWICPCTEAERADYDTWAVLLIAKVLCLYYDCSKDERIIEVVSKCLKQFNSHINRNTLRNWGAARWFEGLIAVKWLYEKTGEEWLIALAKKLRVQGFDWRALFATYLLEACTDEWEYYSHVVNIAMMLKSEALWSLFDDIDGEEFADMAFEYLDKNHGMAIGHFSGDENISGNSPIQGAELCSIVEIMYSLEHLFAVSGNPKWLDRLEQLAFNSLPAAISPDMWSHQYDQMINQVACFPMSKQPFRTNDNTAHTFGLEPHFGCCTANHGQGFPKFTLSTFMKTGKGIASCALSPSVLKTEIDGVGVKCELITEYPFRNNLKYRIETEKDVEFTFSVRIPSFAKWAIVDGKEVNCGEFAEVAKVWKGTSEIDVVLEFETEIIKRPENMVVIRRGPLFYSIPIKEKWEKVEYIRDGVERTHPYCDYYIYPRSKWNYALASEHFQVEEGAFEAPFNPDNPPLSIVAELAEIEWDFNNGHCDRLPESTEPIGEIEKVRLIPYGCTNLRMTEVPFVKKRCRHMA
ncbi:MAG: glycoside hydrolase family 127 protein [Clostridia bacterium]|nr:glycoside hydrolase family 127 protein [Clostridia bacterium]